jgi:polysaccharide biosynthesis protein PslL
MNRNPLIDIAKGVGILFVVFGHNWIVDHHEGALHRIIFAFHMPLFFVLAGMLIKPSITFRTFFRSRLHSLVKPYFVVLVLLCGVPVVKRVLRTGTFRTDEVLPFLGIVYGTGSTIPWMHLWFLVHLFAASIASLFILRSIKNLDLAHKLAVSLFLLCAGYVLLISLSGGIRLGSLAEPARFGLPWSLDLLPITCAYIVFGSCCGLTILNSRPTITRVVAAIATFALLQIAFSETIDFNTRVYGGIFVATTQALCGVYLCFVLSRLLARSSVLARAFAYMGSHSLFILIFHGFFQAWCFGVTARHLSNPYLCGVLSLAAGLSLPLAMYEMSRRISLLRMMLLPAGSGTRLELQKA